MTNNTTPTLQILDFFNALQRYWLVSVSVLVVALILTVSAVRVLPDLYRSTTLIMVQPQDVPESYVRATVATKVEQRLNALSQEVLSRTRLEAIIDDFDLFKEPRERGEPREEIVNAMRGKIQIQVFPRDNAFRISYIDRSPRVAQQVTARLAGLYIDENLRVREQHVRGTTEFLDKEMNRVGAELEKQEAAIHEYKGRHMGELPEQLEANMGTLTRLNTQQQMISLALSSAMERKALLERQAVSLSAPPSAPDGSVAGNRLETRQRLIALQAQLTELRSRYTDRHPDVVALQQQILEIPNEVTDRDPAIVAALPPELARGLNEARLEISRLQKERLQTEAEIKLYDQRIENGFIREGDLLKLTRDYDVTQTKYQGLLSKKLEARLSQDLERRQKGERFRVLDPASRPEVPFSPDRYMLAMMGSVGSLGLSLLLPVLFWQMDSSFHSADEIAEYSSLPVLATIPQALTNDVRKRLRNYRLRVLALALLVLAVGLGSIVGYSNFGV